MWVNIHCAIGGEEVGWYRDVVMGDRHHMAQERPTGSTRTRREDKGEITLP